MLESTDDPPRPAQSAQGVRAHVTAFEAPSVAYSFFQIGSTVALFLAGCVGMYWSLKVGYWLTLALALPTAGFLVRIFIIQHDCGHGSLFRSRRLNDTVGTVCSLMTLAPYAHWRRQHALHHGNWNNLDRRESGADIYSACLTVTEYKALNWRARLAYRVVRHPVMAHLLIPPAVFLLLYRTPFDTPKKWRWERNSVYLTNLALITTFTLLSVTVGYRQALAVHLPIMVVASVVGVWLFALQHRFDGVLWTRQAEWSVIRASIEGSSYLRLPRLFQWFTGNIGFHHIHHLSPRVPNYRLEACHKRIAELRGGTTIGWRQGLAATRLALWHEGKGRMVRFSDL